MPHRIDLPDHDARRVGPQSVYRSLTHRPRSRFATVRRLLLIQRYYATSNYDKPWAFNHSERHFSLDNYLAACP